MAKIFTAKKFTKWFCAYTGPGSVDQHLNHGFRGHRSTQKVSVGLYYVASTQMDGSYF